jgi:glycosyltransferase involved in cell wall biosynthesis
MPNIAFFSNQLAKKGGTGVARYARNLLIAFTELDTSYRVIPVSTWSDMEKEELNALKVETGLCILPTGRITTRILWTTIGFPRLEHLVDFHVDIVHVNDLGYLVATSKPYVITVHDIGPLIHPEYFPKESNWVMQKNLAYAIKKAVAFICVSQTTAYSLMEFVQGRYSVDVSNKTHVAREGISERFLQAPDFSVLDQDEQFDFTHQPFILAVGKISPRKNIEVVIRALERLRSRIPHHLVTVGGDGWDFQGLKSLVSSLGLVDRVHFVGYVSDEQLHALYAKATLFIFPSLFEGFGLTILEAMSSGCPVVTSNISSLPEVAGDAALLVDPTKIEEVASAMEAICKNDDLANELKQKGRERARQFSWKNCAKETLAIYNSLIS